MYIVGLGECATLIESTTAWSSVSTLIHAHPPSAMIPDIPIILPASSQMGSWRPPEADIVQTTCHLRAEPGDLLHLGKRAALLVAASSEYLPRRTVSLHASLHLVFANGV